MYHIVARALPDTVLWRDPTEANALWRILTRTFPELVALCLMPDHFHLVLPHADEANRLSRALAAYARWRNHRRKQKGPVWASPPPPEKIADDKHLRRTIRYVHLNANRGKLVGDPLAWAWSTHRDATGFALFPVVARDPFPARFHHYISGDPDVAIEGTELPTTRLDRDATWDEVHDTVCTMARLAPEDLLVRGPARTVLVKAAWVHGIRDVRFLARAVGLTERRIYGLVEHLPVRGALLAEPLGSVVRAVGDPRFAGYPPTSSVAWLKYRRKA
jgi:REP element-mobilizing transposase RayT